MESKVPKYENHKLRERKVKTLTRNWRDYQRTGTHKHMETVSRYFDRHGRLSQLEEKHLLSSDWERRPCLSKYLDTVSVCLCAPVLQWSLQFLVRVFTFFSLNLWIIGIRKSTYLNFWGTFSKVSIFIPNPSVQVW